MLKPVFPLIFLPLIVSVCYLALGYEVAPWLLRTAVMAKIGTTLHGTAAVQKVTLDPFRFTAQLDGFTFKGRQGQLLAAFRTLEVDLDLPRSKKLRRLVFSAQLDGLFLHLTRDTGARWSSAFEPSGGDGGLPFLVDRFSLHGGRIELEDDATGFPYAFAFDPMTLTLENFGPEPGRKARVVLTATDDRQESLALEGSLSLGPASSEGTVTVQKLEPGLWLQRLLPGGPLEVRAGVLDLKAAYRYQGGARPALDIRDLQGEGLELAPRGDSGPGYKLSGLALEGLVIEPADGSVRLAKVSVKEVAQGEQRLSGLTARGLMLDPKQRAGAAEALSTGPGAVRGFAFTGTETVDMRWTAGGQQARIGRLAVSGPSFAEGSAGRLEVGQAAWSAASQEVRLEQMVAVGLRLPAGTAENAEAGGLVWSTKDQSGRLDRFSLRRLVSNQGSLEKLDASTLAYHRASQDFQADSLILGTIAAPGPKLSAASVRLEGLAGNLQEPRLQIASLELKQAAAPGYAIAVLTAAGLALRGTEQHLTLTSAQGETVVTPWVQAASVALGAVEGSLKEQTLWLDSAAMKNAVGLGPVEKDRQAPPPAAQIKPGLAIKPTRPGAGRVEPARYIPRAARIGNLELDDLRISLLRHELSIHTLVSERADLDVRLKANRSIQVDGLPELPSVPETQGERKGRSRTRPWHIQVGEIRLADSSSVFRDESVDPPVRLGFAPIVLRLRDFSTDKGRLFRFRLDAGIGERGKLEVDGQGRLRPALADLRFGVDQLWLKGLQPYWQHATGVELTRGRGSLWGDITYRNKGVPDIDFAGGADIVEFDSVDRQQRQPFARWNYLKFDGLVFSNQPWRLGIRTVTSEQPYARVVIGEDGRLNLIRDLLGHSGPSPVPGASRAAGVAPHPVSPSRARLDRPVVAGLLRIKDLKLDFADLRLKPGFAAEIDGVSGTISGLSSQADANARVLLQGNINQSSPVRIFGQINPFQLKNHTDVTLDFHGLNMTTLSGYSSRFAGYRIEKGKLDLTLRYRMNEGRLEVDNRLMLDQLNLGEKVDNPAASTLPIDLAIAVLKDANGHIDLDLPVSGDLNNPSFSLGSLYGEAIRQFFVKLVTAPYTLVSNLTKDASEDLGSIEFKPGQAKLSLTAKTRLAEVADLLKIRPGLHLDVRGVADPEQDKLALADAALTQQLETARREELRAKGTRVPSSVPIELSEADYRRLFARFYRQRHGEIRTGNEDEEFAGSELDQAKRLVLEEWPISELELRLLAQARGNGIREWLVKEGGLTDQRIYLLDVKLDPAPGRLIRALLALTAS